MKNKLLNIIIIVLSTCIFLSFFIFSNGFKSLSNILKTSNTNWILLAVVCIIIFWFLEALIIFTITFSISKTKRLFIKCIKFAMVGQFFSAVTPFQSGSQPAQLYSMIDNDIPPGPASSVLMIKFIIHQTTITIYSLLIFIIGFNYFNSRISYLMIFCILGFIINTLFAIFAVFFSVNEKVTKKVLLTILKVLSKIKIVKDYEKSYEELPMQKPRKKKTDK